MSSENNSLFKTLAWTALGIGALAVINAFIRESRKYSLRDKVVLITGGSRGLGLSIARQLAQRGARIALCARTESQLLKAQVELKEMGADVLAFPVDITDRVEVEKMVTDIADHFGRIDVVINNAGIIQVGPSDVMNLEEYDDAMRTNFWGPLYVIHSAIPYMKYFGEGKIVNITSIGGKIAVPHLLPYSASKFALVGLSEGLHAELKKHNIDVITVVPNLMRTGSPRNITVKGNHSAEYAWFKIADSLPVITQSAERAATDIIKAIEYNETEVVLTLSAKAAIAINGIAPGFVSDSLAVVNRLLPSNVFQGDRSQMGYESESTYSQSLLTTLTDRAAEKNNEL